MITYKGTLTFGLVVDGVKHREFELRLPTMEDMERALEEVPPDSHMARIRRHVWAHCLLSLGTLSGEAITAELLAGLPALEYSHFNDAEEALAKKHLAGSDN